MSESGALSIPDEAWKLIDGPKRIDLDIIPIFQSFVWEYPFIEARPVVREYYDPFGANRLAWGSDMPNVERHRTDKQSMDYRRLHFDFIPQDDLAKILGDDVARLFGKTSSPFLRQAVPRITDYAVGQEGFQLPHNR